LAQAPDTSQDQDRFASLGNDKIARHRAASDLFDKASAAMNVNDFNSAAQMLKQAVMLDDAYGRAHANLGWALMKLNRTDEAIAELRLATSMEPALPQPWSNLAAACVTTGDLPTAVDAYEHYINVQPDGPERRKAIQNMAFLKKSIASGNHASRDDYFAAATQENGLLVWNQRRMPVRVYIDPGNGVNGFRPEYAAELNKSFMDWSYASGGRFTCMQVLDKSQADIVCSWTDDPSKLRLLGEGGETRRLSDRNGLFHAEIIILTVSTSPVDPLSFRMISWVAHHEVGHALGICGHSSDAHDIMFFAGTALGPIVQLSQRDRATISKMYSMSR